MIKMCQITLMMFSCGIFWEYITPVFRSDTISDPLDIFAYILGGIFYWIIIKIQRNKEMKKISNMEGLANEKE